MDDFIVVGRVKLEGTTSASELDAALGSGGVAGSAAKADTALEDLSGSSSKAGEEAEKAAKKHGNLKTGLGQLTSALGVVGGGYTLAAGAAVGLGFALFKGTENAAKQQQTVAILNKTIEQNSGASPAAAKGVDEWADALSRQYGISHEQVLPAMGILVAATKSVGESEKLMATAADIATARHLPLDTVVKALGKGALGTVSGMARLGLQTKDSAGKALSFAQIMKEANKTYGGDAQAAADTTAGRMSKLKETFSQDSEAVMTKLVPALNWMLSGLTKVAAYLPTLAGYFEDAWRDVIEPAVMDVWNDALKYVFDAIVKYVQVEIVIFESLASAVELAWRHVIGPAVTVVWEGVLKPYLKLTELAIKEVLKAADFLYQGWQADWHLISAVLTTSWSIAKPIFDFLDHYIVQVIMADFNLLKTAWTTGWNLMQTAVQTVWSILKPIFEAVEKAVGTISKGIGLVGSVAKTVGKTVTGALTGVASLFAGNLDNMTGPGSGGSGGGVPGAVQSVVQQIAGHLGWSVSDWDKVIMRESGGSLTARNKSSGAYGIAQFIQGPSEYAEWGGNASTIDGQLIAMANYIACLPTDTMILTRTGWKSCDEVEVGDETIGFDPDTDTSRWTLVEAIHRYDDAPLVRMHDKRLDVRCTPTHRWLSEKVIQPQTKPDYRRFEFVATEAIGTRHRLRMAARQEGDQSLPITVVEAELLGWIMGDGCLRRGPNHRLDVLIHQSKARLVVRLRELLAGIPHTEHTPRPNGVIAFRFQAGFVRDLLDRSGYELNLEAMVLAMSPIQRGAFLAGLMGADGCQRTTGSPILAQNEGPKLDAAMLAIFLSGYYGHPTNSAGQKHVTLSRPFLSGKNLRLENDGRAPVWCVTTDLGSWTAKQSGQVFLTGNSRYGNPTKAWAHELSAGWYDRGGVLPPGVSLAVNTTGHDEIHTTGGGDTYNLTINSQATRENLVADFAMMKAMSVRAT